MFMILSNWLFLSCLILGTMISICSNSWFSIWMGLEINLLSFIPLMTNKKNILNSEAALKYFLVQAFASAILLFSVIITSTSSNMDFFFDYESIYSFLVSSTVLLKMGAAPFHFWFPGVMEGLNWINCFILMTWQKIAPLVLLSYVIEMNLFIYLIILISIIIGSLGGLNQTSLRKIMAYSSITHLGWMIAGLTVGDNLGFIYFLAYLFLTSGLVVLFFSYNVYHINQNFMIMLRSAPTKLFLFVTLLSLGGLPPFLGFLPKWIIIQSLTQTLSLSLIILMVISTLVTLFFYLRIIFCSCLMSYSEMKWYDPHSYPSPSQGSLLFLAAISIMGLSLSTLIYAMV
uniref:NADH-ubiquinone oxidoreductase chain 2 n=1 Tax=Conocephalus melaenus TaxID=948344 RepID=A0A1Q1MPG2_9ORTH|nr:NADH dehydrogenase subunit 2 [Conocephalus melaenus]AQM39980.1 NADH dehydrogenase subunit 2 [Conocephalus melaenus]